MNKRKTALITGAANGIGAAIARGLAHHGYNVVINYHSSANQAHELARRCEDLGVEAVALQADVSDEVAVMDLAERLGKEFGTIAVLVNNAGVAQEPDFEVATKADLLTSLTNSLITTMLMTKAFVPKLMDTKSSVINIATIYALDQSGSVGLPVYSAAEAGVINFTQTMAKRYAPNIRFNAVAPGFTLTPHWDSIDEQTKKDCIDMTLQHEWIQPEDIAEAVQFLVDSKHITAQTITVDSGWSRH